MHSLLLVDDDAVVRRALRGKLRLRGFRVVEADGLRRTLKILGAFVVDAIVVNGKLPEGALHEIISAVCAFDARFRGRIVVCRGGPSEAPGSLECFVQRGDDAQLVHEVERVCRG